MSIPSSLPGPSQRPSPPVGLPTVRAPRQSRQAAWVAALRTAELAARAAGAQLLAGRSRIDLAFLSRRTPRQQAAVLMEDAHALARATIARAFPSHAVVGRQEAGLLRPAIAQGPVWLVDALDGEAAYVADRPGWAVSIALAIDGDLRLGVVHDPAAGITYRALAGDGAQCVRPAAAADPSPPGGPDSGIGGDLAIAAPVRTTAPVLHHEVMRTGTRARLADARIAARFPTPGTPAMAAFSPEFGRASQSVADVQRCAATSLALAHLACGRLDAFWTRDHDPCSAAAGLLMAREAGAMLRGRDGLDVLHTRSLAASTPTLAYDFHALLAGL